MNIIAICGPTRSGKETIAKHIESLYGYKHKRISHCLKKGIEEIFGFSSEQLETDIKDDKDDYWGVSPRDVMNFIGTQIFQYEIEKLIPNLNKCFWVNRLLHECENEKRIVISDLRFLHEVDKLSEHNLTVIKVHKSHTVDHTQFYNSELEYIKEDINLNNDSTIDKLLSQLDYELNNIKISNDFEYFKLIL
jgi:dephospho-CoA kinase